MRPRGVGPDHQHRVDRRACPVAAPVCVCRGQGGRRQPDRAMALELGPHGILVNGVAPGSTLTEGTRQLFYGKDGSFSRPGSAHARPRPARPARRARRNRRRRSLPGGPRKQLHERPHAHGRRRLDGRLHARFLMFRASSSTRQAAQRSTSLRLAPNSWPALEFPGIGVPSGLLTLNRGKPGHVGQEPDAHRVERANADAEARRPLRGGLEQGVQSSAPSHCAGTGPSPRFRRADVPCTWPPAAPPRAECPWQGAAGK